MTEPTRYSHPPEDGRDGVLLADHLADVAARVEYVFDVSDTLPSGVPTTDVLRTLAWTHDAGKATTWFQHHIGLGGEAPPAPYYTHHSLFGAFVSAYALDIRDYPAEVILAGTLAVLRHHGTLGDGPRDLFERAEPDPQSKHSDRRDAVTKQAKNVDSNVPLLAERIVAQATAGAGSWADFVEQTKGEAAYNRVTSLVADEGFVPTFSRKHVSPRFYETALDLWSGLVLCDKTSAAGAPNNPSVYHSNQSSKKRLESYIDGLQADADCGGEQGRINELREEARHQVLTAVRETEPAFATITLPTGLGKTLTGLSGAFELLERTGRERIIYALPFTSIIDQVGDELLDVFDSDGADGKVLLHHHLSEAAVTVDSASEDSDALAAIEGMLGESWRAHIVLTTFVQLFESLAGPKNTQSMKLPALHDAVVVLDEPQSLPHRWWPLVDRLVEMLTDQYGAAVLAMTATQPRLFAARPPELVSTTQAFYDELDRVEFHIDSSVESYAELDDAIETAEAVSRLRHSDEQSVLAVCNTIDSAEALFEGLCESGVVTAGSVLTELIDRDSEVDATALADAMLDRSGRPIVYLSTRVRPRDRLLFIGLLKELTARGEPVLCVSTQLIEAGVDISFDEVYRDFAPVDSIVQAAGRCNRSYESDTGRVTVWWLRGDPESRYSPGQAVYDAWGESLLSITKQSLDSISGDGSVISESILTWDCVQEYYQRVAANNPGNRKLVEHLEAGRIDKLERASLIEERQRVDVIICRTAEEERLVAEAREAWLEYEYDLLKECIDTLRPVQVSIPIYSNDSPEAQGLMELEPLHAGTETRVLSTNHSRVGGFFDQNTGFTIPDSTVEARFL